VVAESSAKLLVSQKITSFEELSALALRWDIDYRQVSKNYSATYFDQFQVGSVLFSHLSCGCFAIQTGNTPENMWTIAVPDTNCSDFRYFNHFIDRPTLLVGRAGQEFKLFVRPGHGISCFSISEAAIAAYFETGIDRSLARLLDLRDGVVPIEPKAAARLREVVGRLLHFDQRLPSSPGPVSSAQSFESELLESICKLLPKEENASKELRIGARSQILRRALEYSLEHERELLNVKDQAAAIPVSERTLDRVFRRELGISPKQHHFGKRMYGVHRQLWHAVSSETTVTDVANAWGFWHMGQFAKDYRRFFGELPSATLKSRGANT
jgi:AraC family ethanolamine operon transcriptional activator